MIESQIELPPVAALDPALAVATRRLLDAKTKPRGSLGRLEDLACTLAAVRGDPVPDPLEKAIVVLAADHGVAAQGVSAYPQEVTAQMLLNYARGGAAINVLARQVGARLLVADLGVKTDVRRAFSSTDGGGWRDERIGPGTRDFSQGPAMDIEQAVRALRTGVRLAFELADAGVAVVGLGEMGIGNTTSAAALATALTGARPEDVTGHGTGIDEAARMHKVQVVHSGIKMNRAALADGESLPLRALAALGGFEIAGLAGVAIGAAHRRMVVVLDGFITSVAALAAVRLVPAVREYLVAAHRSIEPGHRIVLDAMQLRPLLELDLRLGEGSGAALAFPLLDAAIRILREMATFSEAGVTDTGKGVPA